VLLPGHFLITGWMEEGWEVGIGTGRDQELLPVHKFDTTF
jgi:hypothetical protein